MYGVDLNRVAVELARLAIWVHTFVPGLPLSFLDHNLVCGDSLTGVGGLDEAVAAFEPDADPQAPSLFRSQLEELLARAEESLRRLARTSDATKREIDQARAAHEEAQQAVAPAKALFDVLTAHRAGALPLPENYDEDTFVELSGLEEVTEAVAPSSRSFPGRLPRGVSARAPRIRLSYRQPTVGDGKGGETKVVGETRTRHQGFVGGQDECRDRRDASIPS